MRCSFAQTVCNTQHLHVWYVHKQQTNIYVILAVENKFGFLSITEKKMMFTDIPQHSLEQCFPTFSRHGLLLHQRKYSRTHDTTEVVSKLWKR